MSRSEIAHDVAKMLVEIGAVSFRLDPLYVYTSGIQSPIYIDNRRIISFPEVREKIMQYYVEMMDEHIGRENVEIVSGTGVAAIPHAAWIAQMLDVPLVYVRSMIKGHGHKKAMEGVFEPGQKVVVIEDAISQGGSSIRNAEIIRSLGGVVEYVVGTFTYDMSTSYENYEKAGLQVLCLTTGREVAEQAFLQGLATDEEQQAVLEWMDNPFHWADSR